MVDFEVAGHKLEPDPCPDVMDMELVGSWLVIVVIPRTVPFPLPMIEPTLVNPFLVVKEELDSEVDAGKRMFGTVDCIRVVGIEDVVTGPLSLPEIAGTPAMVTVVEIAPLPITENMASFVVVVVGSPVPLKSPAG